MFKKKLRRVIDAGYINEEETWELFKMIRGVEYRRGKEDALKEGGKK